MGNEQKESVILEVVTLSGTQPPLACDSVHLNVSDDLDGRGGGSYGIRQGHVNALISLQAGPLTAYQNGKVLLQAQAGDGFATVKDNKVTVVVDTFQKA